MAKIVIDISNDTYYRCKNERVGLLPFDIPGVCNAIKNGTVLPKGHGRLVDEKDLSLVTVHMIDGMFVCDAPTIIEADKGEE